MPQVRGRRREGGREREKGGEREWGERRGEERRKQFLYGQFAEYACTCMHKMSDSVAALGGCLVMHGSCIGQAIMERREPHYGEKGAPLWRGGCPIMEGRV